MDPGDFGPRGSPFISRDLRLGLKAKDFLDWLDIKPIEPRKCPEIPLRDGLWQRVEDEANEILRLDKKSTGGDHHGTWHGILTPDQLEMRTEREISMEPYVFDVGLRSGLYVRAWNPLMGIRPRSRPHWVDDAPLFDIRVGMASPQTGWSEDLKSFRDPEWPTPMAHHLDRFQRCRIRRTLRDVPPGYARLRSLTRWVLAAKYGVTVKVIMSLELNRPIEVLQ